MRTILFYALLTSFVLIEINCQDDDYDTDPEEAVNSDYVASEQPEFFKNAFADTQSRQSYMPGNPWDPYLRYYPFSNAGDQPRSFSSYSPFVPIGQSFDHSAHETKSRSKPMNDDDFFSDYSDHKTKNEFDSSSFKSNDKPPHSMNRPTGYHPQQLMFNYGLPYGGNSYGRSPATGGQFNPYQQNVHPIGAHLYPYTQQHQQQRKKKDNFDEELKKLGINMDDYLGEGGGGGGGQTEEPQKKRVKKEKKKKKDKKRPLFPNLLNTFKVATTTTESPTQNKYLKSNVENDISNLGFNMDNYGIKEHKLEKQVYGQDKYQYPMQALPNGFRNQDYSGGSGGDLNDLKTLNSHLNQYSDDKLNSLLKLTPINGQSAMLPILNSNGHSTINPYFTADNSANGLTGLAEITAINLLENSFNDLNGYGAKANQYHHSNAPFNTNENMNINENFKSFAPARPASSGGKKYPGAPPKFLEDEFFKTEKKKATINDDESDYEPVNRKKHARKGKLGD